MRRAKNVDLSKPKASDLTLLTTSFSFLAEFYRGIVTDVNTDKDTYDVVYDDGEEDLYLYRPDVRQFKPYSVGETLQARVQADEFAVARVVEIHKFIDDEGRDVHKYDITFLKDNKHKIIQVASFDLRRYE